MSETMPEPQKKRSNLTELEEEVQTLKRVINETIDKFNSIVSDVKYKDSVKGESETMSEDRTKSENRITELRWELIELISNIKALSSSMNELEDIIGM